MTRFVASQPRVRRAHLSTRPRRAYRMVMPALADRFWTPEDILALPDDGARHECIDGVHLVTPTPRMDHQRVAMALARRLRAFAEQLRLGEVFELPGDLRLEQTALVQPDVFVIRQLPGSRRPRSWSEVTSLWLAVEVLSPSTARTDRTRKRALYQRTDVGEYWIVDADARVVERWRADDSRPEILSGSMTWQPMPDHPALVIDLDALFAEVYGDDDPVTPSPPASAAPG